MCRKPKLHGGYYCLPKKVKISRRRHIFNKPSTNWRLYHMLDDCWHISGPKISWKECLNFKITFSFKRAQNFQNKHRETSDIKAAAMGCLKATYCYVENASNKKTSSYLFPVLETFSNRPTNTRRYVKWKMGVSFFVSQTWHKVGSSSTNQTIQDPL